MSDRSDDALRERLELAKKATRGPWKSDEVLFRKKNFEPSYVVKDGDGRTIVDILPVAAYQETAQHIAANHPDVVRADLEEILALRAEVARLRAENEALKNLALKLVKSSSALLEKFTRKEQSAINDVVLFYDQMRDKLRAREEWLARELASQGNVYGYEPFCPMPGDYKCELRLGCDLCRATVDKRAECWRKAADMATRENPGEYGDLPESERGE